MKRRKTSAAVLVLFGLAAILCIANCVGTLRHGQMEFLQFLCAVVWTCAFFIQLRRYRNEKDE